MPSSRPRGASLRPPVLLLVPLALASWGFGPSEGPVPSALEDPCALPGTQPEPLSLAALWQARTDHHRARPDDPPVEARRRGVRSRGRMDVVEVAEASE